MSAIVESAAQAQGVDLRLESGEVLRIEAVTADILRVRRAPAGAFPESGLERYGFLRREWPEVKVETVSEPGRVLLKTASLTVEVPQPLPLLRITTATGEELLREVMPGWSGAEGFGARFALDPEEQFVGFGDQTRDRVGHRGHTAQMWVANVTSYTPIPFCMSTRGYGLFVNSTWRHGYDLGAANPGEFGFSGPQGSLDYYVIHGPHLPAILERYTSLTGRPYVAPLWSFGLWYVMHMDADAWDLTDSCYHLRSEHIPCDIVGLEPGWMETFYDFSVEKKWHPERFPIPSWAQFGPSNFLDAVKRMGFKVSLWLCNDYDLTYEEERRLKQEEVEVAAVAAGKPAETVEGVMWDEHLEAGVRLDKLTRPGEPWFQHLKHFVDQGVEVFKQDGANQTLDHPDRKWGNGMDDEEMHNLYCLLYSKQMHLGYREHTGRRATLFTPDGYAGLQRWTGTWAGDTGGGPKPLVSMLNLGLSGHSLVSCDMEVVTKEGIHFGFLQPWSQVCSWYYFKEPWLLGDELGPVFKDYARLRYRLLPYIYATAHQAYRTGMPMLRALPLIFPDDPKSYEVLTQYMLGDAFLVSAFSEEVYLPEGQWTDYWTGQVYEGPQTIAYPPPVGKGGGLFVRAGSILPMVPVMDYVGQRPWDEITLDVYPGASGDFTLVEDDGITYDYEQGVVTETRCSCAPTREGVVLRISAPTGTYEGLPANRTYRLTVHLPAPPREVRINGEAVSDWTFAESVVTVDLGIVGREAREVTLVS